MKIPIVAGILSLACACTSLGATTAGASAYRFSVEVHCNGSDVMVREIASNIGSADLSLGLDEIPWHEGQAGGFLAVSRANLPPDEDVTWKQWNAGDLGGIVLRPGASESREFKLLDLFPEAATQSNVQLDLLWRQRNPKNPTHSDGGVIGIDLNVCHAK